MFLFAFWVIRALKCEAVNFIRFESAGVPVRPFEYLDTPIIIIACAPCMHTHDVHAQHDVRRFYQKYIQVKGMSTSKILVNAQDG